MKEIKDLEKILMVNFDNHNILLQALTHRSYINENKSQKLRRADRAHLFRTGKFHQRPENPGRDAGVGRRS